MAAKLLTPYSKSPSISDFSFNFSYKPKYSDQFKLTGNSVAIIVSKAKLIYPKVQKVHNIEEFDAALLLAKQNLVLVEYISGNQSHPLTAKLSRKPNAFVDNADVFFVLVKADESEKTKQLCKREKIEKIPFYTFHKNMKRIHEKPKLKLEELIRYVQYYVNYRDSAVIQLHCKEEMEKMIMMEDQNKLIVLNVGLVKDCEPCVRVYPTMVKLSEMMRGDVVFARLLGDDENGGWLEFMRSNDIVRVPSFLFIRGGEICGRYVGSGNAKLVRKVVEYRE